MSNGQRLRPGMSWWDKAAIGAMGGVGGALSYDALQQMAVAMHIRPELTYLFPVAIDGFIAYGTRALVVLKEAPLRARFYTWSVFGSATATSVWANWTHAVRLNDLTPPSEGLHLSNWSVGVLSTIAPLVLGGATHLYIVMSRHTSGADADPEPASETQESSKTRWWSRRGASGQDDPTKTAVRTRWWSRKRTEDAALESAASATADEHPELTAVPAPSPVSLTKAHPEPAALPPESATISGTQPQAVPTPGTESAAANGTVPGPQASAAAPGPGTVPENRTAPAPATAPVGPEQKPGAVPGTTASPGPASSPSGTVPTVPAESVPLVHAAPPAVPAAAATPAEHGPRHRDGSVPNGSAASRPAGEADGTGQVSDAIATATPHTPASAATSPPPVPAVPAPADAATARPCGPGTVPAQPTALRAVPTPGTASTGTGPEPRPLPDPAKEAGPHTGTVDTPGTPTVHSGDRPRQGPGTVPRISTTPKAVPAAPSPVPGAARGPDREARKRELSEDELEALLPIGRTVAATAEGRLTRETLRAGLRAQNVPINNTALGQLLRELKDIEGKPPPARR
ncbi:DUF2637 domain-containing protein [Kitasatospora sp. NPDC051984]|uniref:DUF2637 domain-containing protein n=1 Tax=Kitasatospora sp. NPDC051984 TaxID=3364059 RepID=UPI0037CBC155